MGLTVILLFFGIAKKIFKSFGIAYWLAFVIVGVLIGCAFIPTFYIGGVKVNVAGFIAPILFAGVFFFLAVRVREGGRAAVTTTAVFATCIASELLLEPVTSATVTVIVNGFLCGAVAFLVGKTKLSALCAVFLGLPLGDVVAAAMGTYVYGNAMRLGSPAMFDSVILAAVIAIALFETVAAIKRAIGTKNKALAEVAEEFDPDEYKRYFDE